jgi:TolB-like protein/DNA-binding winged helix-turn-helix (wHTH) protein/tetratricopeptide (TPR) repeat protein
MKYSLGSCTIDTEAYEIRRDGKLVPVEPQVFDLLVLLLRNRNRLVTKDEIFERIWNGRIVSDAALSSRVRSMREAIGDDGTSQALIRTVRGRGFRLVAPVIESSGSVVADTMPDPGIVPSSEIDRPITIGRPLNDILVDQNGDCCAPLDSAPGQAGTGSLRRVVMAGAVIAIGLVTTAWYALQPGRGLPFPIAHAALGMPAGPGIAVLPFSNPASDAALDFFGGAITDEIITELTRYSELRVAARTTTSEFDGKDIDIRNAGRRLGAAFLVTGSLRRVNDRVRVTAQLMKVTDATLLWADTYERQLTPADMFSVQQDIATKTVAAIASISSGVIARDALGHARGKPPRELSAYECTVRANEIMTYSAPSHLAIRTCLETAVDNEPDYAAAWAMLAWIHTIEYSQGFNVRPESDPRERALAAARRAIELAPANPMARFAMARAAYLKRDLDVFYAEAARALSLNPHEPFLLGNIGSWLAFTGRWDEGVALIRKAIALNSKVYPRWWHAALGKDHYRRGDYREALAEFKTMNLPNWFWNQVELAYTYGQLGDLENAQKATAKLYELYPGFDLEKAVMEHRKFSFEQSYIDRAVDGLRKAGVPDKAM